MPDDRLQRARWLSSSDGRTAVDAATEARKSAHGDALRASTLLRTRTDLPPDRAAAALEQAELAETARLRHGVEATNLLLTRDGLEAATRPVVADFRAKLLRTAGVRRVLDLTGGLGLDTAAFLRAGLQVTALERDPVVATYLRHNCPDATVINADATDAATLAGLLGELSDSDVVFVDPARRDPAAARDSRTARARPERDPDRWSPPWSWVEAIPHPRVAAKVSPAFTPPDAWTAEWISVNRTVVECAMYSWAIGPVVRSALILGDDGLATEVLADAAPAQITGDVGTWLHEIDPAVIRATAVASLARAEELAWLGPGTTWLTGDHPSLHPALRSHQVVADLSRNDREARRQLADLSIAAASIKCRDVAATPRDILRALRIAEGPEHAIVATTVGGNQRRVLVQPAQTRR